MTTSHRSPALRALTGLAAISLVVTACTSDDASSTPAGTDQQRADDETSGTQPPAEDTAINEPVQQTEGDGEADDEGDGDTVAITNVIGDTDDSVPEVETAFPVTLSQQFGDDVTVEAAPERIVALDNWSVDFLTSLGITPVLATSFGPLPAYLPDGAADEVATIDGALNVEQVALADPDLIVDLSGFFTTMDPTVGDQLADIAPLLSPPTDALGDSWEDRYRHLGAALGLSDEVDASIADTLERLAAITDEFPALDGAAISFTRYNAADSVFSVVIDDSDFTRRFLNDELGLATPAPQLDAFENGAGEFIGGVLDVSAERVDIVAAGADAAVVFIAGPADALDADPVWSSLPLVQADKVVFVDLTGVLALRIPGPAAADFLISEIVPELAAAVER